MIRVVAGALVQRGRLLGARRPDHKAHGGFWELPGGKVEPGESDADALIRELREELDVDVEVFGEVGRFVGTRIELVAYEVRVRSGTVTALEHAELRWLDAHALWTVPWAEADVPLVRALEPRLSGGSEHATLPPDALEDR